MNAILDLGYDYIRDELARRLKAFTGVEWHVRYEIKFWNAQFFCRSEDGYAYILPNIELTQANVFSEDLIAHWSNLVSSSYKYILEHEHDQPIYS